MTNIQEAAQKYLYKELKNAKIALGRAETRPGVTQEELDNLNRKIAVLDWLTPLALVGNAPKPKRESRALKPCPKCGKTSRSGYLHVWYHSSIEGKFQYIRCESCGYNGRKAKTEIQARRNWNNDVMEEEA